MRGRHPAGSRRRSARDLVAESQLPRHEAERLLVAATGLDRFQLATRDGVDAAAADRFIDLAARRRRGEPLQYLEGTTQFGPLELLTDARALIPRPETEQLWELVVGRLAATPPRVIVDLCTGSGNLALALKHRFPAAAVFGTDASSDALALAAANQERTGLEVTWCAGDLFAALPGELQGRVDLMVANPPYLAEAEFAGLPADVRLHEPRMALVAGPRGDEVLAAIAAEAAHWLRPGGVIACEISEFRSADVTGLFAPYGGDVADDAAGRPRFVIGSRPAG